MPFSTKEKTKDKGAFDFSRFAAGLEKRNPNQGPVLTRRFEINATPPAIAAATSILALTAIAWPLGTPIILEGLGMNGWQQNAGLTIGQGLSTSIKIAGASQPVSILPPGFPPGPAGYTAPDPLSHSFFFGQDETWKDFDDQPVVLMPDTYTITLMAIGTFAIGDVVNVSLMLFYRQQLP